MKLQQFKELIEEAGLVADIIPAEETKSTDVLLVRVGSVDHTEENPDEREWQLEISIVPMFGEELENNSLVQFFSCLHPEVPKETANTIYSVLGNFNTQVPLGAFGYVEAQNVLYYRHSQLVHKEDDFKDTLSELVWLIVFILTRYSDVPLAAASGKYDTNAILKEIGL